MLQEAGDVLTDRARAMAMLWMMPADLEKETLRKPKAIREDYAQLRTICEDAISAHSSGMSPTVVGHVAEEMGGDDMMEVSVVNADTGEVEVMAIQRNMIDQARRRATPTTSSTRPSFQKSTVAGG